MAGSYARHGDGSAVKGVDGAFPDQGTTVLMELNGPTDKDALHEELTHIDMKDMHRLGRQQQLKRNFGFLPILGFNVVLMSTWETMLMANTQGVIDGGTAGLIWMFVIVYTGLLFVYASLAELASMMPTSGGQYHWVAELAPKSSQRFLSYIIGWICVLAWQSGIASISFLAGTQIQGLIALNITDYDLARWQGTLLVIAVAIFAVVCNTLFAKFLPLLEVSMLVLHLLGFLGIFIPLWVMGDPTDASTVFTTFSNRGGWPTTSLACMVGMLSPVFALIGADAGTHMSEEIRNASYNLPRSMMYALLINGALGFAMIITFCFFVGDIDSVLMTKTGYPYIAVFHNVTKSTAGTSVMTAVLITLTLAGIIANVATASRQMFAFARDRGLPASSWLSKVQSTWVIPFNAILVSLLITSLLSLINIGSTVAFNAIASLGNAALTSSYMLSLSCLIWKRICRQELPHARWSLGRYGLAINITALLFLIVIFVFSFFPIGTPVVAKTMNWSIVIYGAAMIFSLLFYFVWGYKVYRSPVVLIRRD